VAVTPYAREYGMNWLYAAATATNLARVGSRQHWVSDTVGGALLGYALGELAWQARRDARLNAKGPTLAVAPDGVALKWALP
ncbi:MAG TPA: phosphatase PAP2 family protein, partial [Burkholderiales bacterium]|nr:phosphatase PAP2 family protein [Burkholderiales bacterium]